MVKEQWIERKLTVYVNGKGVWSKTIKFRKPNINLKIHIKDYPSELGVGIVGNGIIEIIDEGSEIDLGLLCLVINDIKYQFELKRNERKEFKVSLRHGNNIIKVLKNDSVLAEETLHIKPIPPQISLSPKSELKVVQGQNSLSFTIEDNNIPYEIVSIQAYIDEYEANTRLEDKNLTIDFTIEKPKIEHELHIRIKIKDIDGNERQYTSTFLLPLWIEKYGLVKEKIQMLKERINYLKNRLELIPITDILPEYSNLSLMCTDLEKILNEKICIEIEELDPIICNKLNKQLFDYIYSADLENAIRLYSIIDDICQNIESMLCNDLDRYRSHIGAIADLFKTLDYIKLDVLKLIDKLAILEESLEICGKLTIELTICNEIKNKFSRYKVVYERYVNAIRELIDTITIDLDEYNIENAINNFNKVYKLCEILGFEDPVCNPLEDIKNQIDSIDEVLNSVLIKAPEKAPYDWIEVIVVVNNPLDRVLKKLRIDLSPAKEYFETPSEEINIPPLYPKTTLQHVFRLKPKYMGKLVVPYRICFSEYCIDKSFSINIVRETITSEVLIKKEFEKHRSKEIIAEKPIESHVITLSDFDGKPIEFLKVRPLPYMRPSTLPNKLDIEGFTCHGILSINDTSAVLLCNRAGKNQSFALKIPIEFYNSLIKQEERRLIGDHLNEFIEYVQTLLEIRHPNIVKYFTSTSFPDLDTPVLIMEFCEYGDLNNICHSYIEEFNNPKNVLELIIPVTSAIAYLHRHKPSIVHGNLKLSNILINKDHMVKVTDVSLYKSYYFKANKTSSIHFAPPEQLNNQYSSPLPTVDVWSIGAIMYYLLTRRPPYPIIMGKPDYTRKPARPSFENSRVVKDLDIIILKTLEINPEDRFSNANELLNELINVYQEHYRGAIL